jgi:diguanylate cyclase (GGDEF)-like protein
VGFTLCTLDVVEGDKLVVRATSSDLPKGASVETDLNEGGLAAKTYRTGRTIAFGCVSRVPEAKPTREEFRSGISAPLGDFGVFQVVSTERNAFSREDVKLLELLLGHVAEAVRRIRYRDELRDQAIRDPLTGVYNRRYFHYAIEQEIARSSRHHRCIGFLMIDVNRFKEINDSHGHQTGDRVLCEVASFLDEQVRGEEMVVRYGGDEFLVVTSVRKGDIQALKDRILDAFSEWNETDSPFDFPVSIAVGCAQWNPETPEPLERVLAKADEAMYEHKRSAVCESCTVGS